MFNFKKTALAAAVITMVPAVSYAQLEEVLVTATKREVSVQDLPFSINAMTEQDINRTGSTNMEELSRNVAGLTIQNLGPGLEAILNAGGVLGQSIDLKMRTPQSVQAGCARGGKFPAEHALAARGQCGEKICFGK